MSQTTGADLSPAVVEVPPLTSEASARLRRVLVSWVLPVVVYCGVSVAAFWPIGMLDASHLTTPGQDLAEFVWALAWIPHALSHLTNPFFTASLNAPYGVNLAANTSIPLLGFVFSPFTVLFGPVASYNLAIHVAFAASALAMYGVLRRYVRHRVLAFVGGLLYGFSPYMVGQGFEHLNLVFVPLPPLLFLVLDDLVSVRSLEKSPRRLGFLLGLLAALQYLVSAEVLVECVVLGIIGILLVAGSSFSRAHRRARRVVVGVAWSLLPVAVLTGYPIVDLLVGAGHLSGSPQAYELQSLRADLASVVIPSRNERVGTASLLAHGTNLLNGDWVEKGVYLGVPLLFLLAFLAVRARHRRVALLSAALCFAALVFALGSSLVVNGTATGIPLPFSALDHFVVFSDETPARYALFVQFFAAILLAVGLDELWLPTRAPDLRPGVIRAGFVGLLGLVALVPVFPRLPYASFPASVPSFFTDGQAASAIPPGSVVLNYPYPLWPNTEALIFQADAGIDYSLLGSSLNTPQSSASAGEGIPPLLAPPQMQALFAYGINGSSVSATYGSPGAGVSLGPADTATLSALRAFCRDYDVQTIVVDPVGDDPGTVLSYLTAALGRAPLSTGGVELYSNVLADLRTS